MHRIISILGVEERRDKDNKLYYRTHARLDTGEEVVGWGSDFEIGDEVMHFYSPEFDVIKMRKPSGKSA